MAQSNHHRPISSAGGEERPARRPSCRAPRHRRDLSAFAGHRVGATRLPVAATDEPRNCGACVCVGQARS